MQKVVAWHSYAMLSLFQCLYIIMPDYVSAYPKLKGVSRTHWKPPPYAPAIIKSLSNHNRILQIWMKSVHQRR